MGEQNRPIRFVGAYENRAAANYDALQTKLEKRFSAGYLARISYTWSHNIDDSIGVFQGAGDFRGDFGGPINPLDFSLDRGNSSLDRRHLFAANVIWDMPFGNGQRWLGDARGPLQAILGGWQSNFIFSGSTGQHFSVRAECEGFDPDGPGPQPEIACTIGRSNAVLLSDPFTNVPEGFINPAAFARPTVNPNSPGFAGTTCVNNLSGKLVCFGNSGRNQFTGPGYFRTDFSLFKNTQLTEQLKMQFGIEFFNLFNHNDPLVPENDFDTGGRVEFGEFRSSQPPRTVQYRLKFLF